MNDPGVPRRVDLPIVEADLEMKVGTGGPAGLSHPANLLLGRDLFPRAHKHFRCVGVQRRDPAAVVDLDRVSVPTPRAGAANHPLARRPDRIACRGAQIDSWVKFVMTIYRIGAVPEGAGHLVRKADRQT
jgi:hypothetical protein